ncbi:MAG: Rho-binding antiterminator [Maribacter sp.]|jgi:Rho-binding antiterminator
MKEYKAISCTYYDYIEHYATLRQMVNIQYKDEANQLQSIQSIILDTKNNGKAEYIIVKDMEQPIRLDNLVSIEDKKLADYWECK